MTPLIIAALRAAWIKLMKSLNRSRLAGTSLLLAFAAMGAAQVTYHVTELAPANGFTTSSGWALNDKGEAVRYSAPTILDFNYVGTLWKGGAAINLGKVQKGKYSMAEAINGAGVITGEGDDGSIRPEAVTFKGGIATLFDSGANNSRGIFVGENGVIVGNYAKGFGGGGWNPVIWTPDPKKAGVYKRFFLPHFQDPSATITSYNYANGANNNGQVVGQISSSLWSARGGLWSNDATHSLTLLEPLAGQWDSYANGINDRGTIAGISDVGVFSMTPVIWSGANHAISPLPLLPGEINGYAGGINNAGQVIGWHGEGSRPCVWIDGQIVDIESALDASGAGWTLGWVSDINNVGQIVGSGTFNGKARGFVLTPVGPAL